MKNKKKKNDEIEITNYIDDFDYDEDDEVTEEIDDEEEITKEIKKEEPTIEDEEDEEDDDELEDTKEFIIDDDEDEDDPFSDDGSISIDESAGLQITHEDKPKEKVKKIKLPKEKKPRKRYRLKKSAYILLAILVLIIIIIVFSVKASIKHKEWINSDKYKLLQKGYTEEVVNEVLNSKELTTLFLNHEFNNDMLIFTKQKYYLSKNLDKYLAYYAKHNDKSVSDIVTIINTETDKDWYNKESNADITKGKLILVNKFYYLDEDYVPEDLTAISVKYAYNDKKVTKETSEAFVKLAAAANGDDIKIVASQGYRSYKQQSNTYTNAKNSKGLNYADTYAARPGHSDYQTGLAVGLDVSKLDEEQKNELYLWLNSNAHRYGFIIRYPEGKEAITGFKYEPAHLRYVGVDAATTIHNENITFEEYYAYYVVGNK